jgi:hypothetical protein
MLILNNSLEILENVINNIALANGINCKTAKKIIEAIMEDLDD